MPSPRKVLFTRTLAVFIAAMILANIASAMMNPLMPLYVQKLGANVSQVGLFFTLSAIAPTLFKILGGWLSDTIGRLQAVAIGSTAGLISYVVFLVSPTWEWLLLGMVFSSVAMAFVAPSFSAFVAEQTDPENLGKTFGITNGIFNVIGIIGPPLGGFLSDSYSFKAMFLAASLFYGCATIIRIWMSRHATKKAAAAGTSAEKPSLTGLGKSLRALVAMVTAGGVVTWILISDTVSDTAFNTSFQFQPLYMQNLMHLTNTQIGWLASIGSVTTMLLMAGAGWLSDKKGERVGIVGGFGLIAAGLLFFLVARDFYGFAVTWVLFGAGQALIEPAYNALIAKAVPNHLRGTAFGLFSTSVGITSLPAPYIGGVLWEQVGPWAPFLVTAAALSILIPVLWVKFRLPKTAVEEELVAEPAPAD